MNVCRPYLWQVATALILSLFGSPLAAEIASTPIVFPESATRIVRTTHQTKHAVSLTFTDTALRITDDGPTRMLAYWERASKPGALTIPYADILSASYDAGPINRYLLIRYRRGSDGKAITLNLKRDVATEILAMLEARSGLRVIES
jgi:hypothetical protein